MRHYLLIAICCLTFTVAYAQDDLLAELEKDQSKQKDYTIQTFKGTRIVNGHSIETKAKGGLEFIVSHRFGTLNSGSYNAWGLDEATIRLGLEYGITDNLGVGIGRSVLHKTIDGYLKYKAIRQSTGQGSVPFTVTLLGSVTNFREKFGPTSPFYDVSSGDRFSYVGEVMIARKFSPAVSFQVSPVFVHRNAVVEGLETHDLFALGLGGRVKITRSVALSAEYFPRLNENSNSPNYDAIGLGIDIETGGHVFQLIFTNTQGMMEQRIVSETDQDFFDGGIHFGFNITRTFQLSNRSKEKSW